MRHEEGGFTLAEVLTVMVILGILATIAVGTFTSTTSTSEKVACLSNQRTLTDAVLQYETSHGGQKPDSIDDLEPYVKSLAKASWCPADGRALVWDAVTSAPACTYPGH